MATLVGDPPNVIIGSAAGLTFLDFVVYLGTVAVLVGLVTSVVFRGLLRDEIAHQAASERPPTKPGAELLWSSSGCTTGCACCPRRWPSPGRSRRCFGSGPTS